MFSALRTPLWLYLNPARHHIWGKDDKQTVLQSRSSLDQFLHIFFPPFFYLDVKQLIKIIYFCYSKIKGEKEAQDTFKRKKLFYNFSVSFAILWCISCFMQGLSLPEILAELQNRRISFAELLAIPEQDDWVYGDGEYSRSCVAFITQMYKVAGLFNPLNASSIQASEFTVSPPRWFTLE